MSFSLDHFAYVVSPEYRVSGRSEDRHEQRPFKGFITLVAKDVPRVWMSRSVGLVSHGRICVMLVLATLCVEYPSLRLDITFTDRRVDLIEENIDIAVRLSDTGNSASLAGRKITTQRSVICASPAYIHRHGLPGSAEELLSHCCLGFSRDGRVLPWKVLDENGGILQLEPTVRHIVSHGEALRDAAVRGMGIAFLSTWLAGDEIAKGELRILPVKTPEYDAPVTALWPVSRNLSPRIRVVVDRLYAAFNTETAPTR